ncbi:MAG: helix-turn-helix domain-containing protein [Pseudomonadota bacterium]
MHAKFVNTAGAAAFVGVSSSTLEQWRRKGIGPAFVRKGPKLILYVKADLETYLENLPRQGG